MRQLLALVRLDLRLFFRDRRALLVIIGIPIGIASFIGFLTDDRNRTSEFPRTEVVLTDLDDSPLSRRLIRGFSSDTNFLTLVTNAEAARPLVLSGKWPTALQIPRGFGTNLLVSLLDTNRKPELTVLFDPSRKMEKTVLEGLLVPKLIRAVVGEVSDPETAREFLRTGRTRLDQMEGLTEADRQRAQEGLQRADDWLATRKPGTASDGGVGTLRLPFSVRSEAVTHQRRPYNGYAHSFAGMSLQFVLMGMVDFAVNLLRERDTGIFRRLRAAPLSRGKLLLGKLLAQAVIALISLVACFAFVMSVFGVRIEGSWIGFLLLIASAPIMAATFGLMLAAVGGTPAGTRGISIALVLFLVMLGGAWFPSFLFPAWLQSVSRLTPIRWAVEGFDAVTWRGQELGDVLPTVAVLLGFAAVFGTIGWHRFRWNSRL